MRERGPVRYLHEEEVIARTCMAAQPSVQRELEALCVTSFVHVSTMAPAGCIFSLPTACHDGDYLAEIPTTALRVHTHQQGLRL
jgi:hypothetical protein